MKLQEVLDQECSPGPFVVDGNNITANGDDGCVVAKGFLNIYDERECPEEMKANLALMAHCTNKLPVVMQEFRNFINALPEEYDDLHTKNLIERAERVLADAEEVEGDMSKVYEGEFTNRHGEKFYFKYNQDTKKGELTGSEIGEGAKIEFTGDSTIERTELGLVLVDEDFMLTPSEALWFKACLAEATAWEGVDET